MISLNYRHRSQTKAIVQHILTDLPESVTGQDVESIFRGLGMFRSPFHFIQLPDGSIEDGRDVRAVGGFFQDSIDIAVLCVDQEPSARQRNRLDDLVAALLLDHPPNARPRIVTIHERQFSNSATA